MIVLIDIVFIRYDRTKDVFFFALDWKSGRAPRAPMPRRSVFPMQGLVFFCVKWIQKKVCGVERSK